MDYQPNEEVVTPTPPEEPKKPWTVYILVILLVLVLAGIAVWYFVFNKTASPTVSQPQDQNQQQNYEEQSAWSFNLIKIAFAQSTNDGLTVSPSLNFGAPIFSELKNIDSFSVDSGIDFTANQQAALEENGFFLAEQDFVNTTPRWDDFIDIYDHINGSSNKYGRQPDDAVFISSDLALHLYHVLVDRTFQNIEEKRFQPSLRAMTETLFLDSIKNYNTATDAKIKDSYKRLSAYYLIPLVVLDAGSNTSSEELKPEDFDTFAQYLDAVDQQMVANSEADLTFSLNSKEYAGQQLSDEIYDLAKQELELIQNARGLNGSPLFSPLRPDFTNDYSQFKPRSHYTKNDVLRSYFIAMMWYGRMGFPLSSEPLTRDALLITAQINNLEVADQELSTMWSEMVDVIDFFVGEVDDLTAYQYTDEIKKVYGGKLSINQIINDESLNNFIVAAKEDLPNPRIVSEALAVYDDSGERDKLLAEIKQFRFMGQRFTPDAYIINNLTQGVGSPDPETGQMLPTMPTALMPLKVIASDNDVVDRYLTEWVNDPDRIAAQERESDKIIPKVINRLKAEFDAYTDDAWEQNIYWRWFAMFKTLLRDYGQGYPYFMQSEAWASKNMSTALGSYTELKHDTLLYAKQSYAEFGGGGGDNGEVPPVAKGYVEPDLTFWNQIISLAEVTQQGLQERNLFPVDFEARYGKFIESAKFFRELSQKELSNQLISEDDFEKLRTINSDLTRIVEPLPGQELTDKEKRAGLIADIHTDAVKEQILYEATAKPYIIYVAVEDANGARLTRGAIFNHYEFANPLDERLSDEDWQDTVYVSDGVLPAADKWYAELIK